jgi:hypothetical protein
MSPVGLRSEKDCAGDSRQKLKTTGSTSRQRGRLTLLVREGASHQQTRNCPKIIKERRGKIGRESKMGA